MRAVLVWIAFVLVATAFTGWVANDALVRGRRWIALRWFPFSAI
jgi:hypothetical protein